MTTVTIEIPQRFEKALIALIEQIDGKIVATDAKSK
jgi:hypothetical protein